MIFNILIKRIKLLLSNKNGFREFAYLIGERESNNNYQAKNSFGFLGAYQFGMARLCDLGLTERVKDGMDNDCFKWKEGMSEDMFLNSAEVQDQLFFRHCTDLAGRINKEFGSEFGKQKHGVMITLSGLIAGAHLLGIGGVRDFINNGENKKDGYNTSIKDYIQSFVGFDLEKLI
jgi:hypothetical protein